MKVTESLPHYHSSTSLCTVWQIFYLMPSVCALQKIRKLEAIGYQDIGIKHKFGSWEKGGKRFWNIETFTDAVVLVVKNGTWKRTCGISCLRSLAPMWRFAMQHHPGNIHLSFATPRYSATPCYVLIQLPNVIDTISKRWRSKKAFNTSPCQIFS